MTKIVKIKPRAYNVKKEFISKFGEMVYHSEGVESVSIRVNFEDGSNLGFKRDEGMDNIDIMRQKHQDE